MKCAACQAPLCNRCRPKEEEDEPSDVGATISVWMHSPSARPKGCRAFYHRAVAALWKCPNIHHKMLPDALNEMSESEFIVNVELPIKCVAFSVALFSLLHFFRFFLCLFPKTKRLFKSLLTRVLSRECFPFIAPPLTTTFSPTLPRPSILPSTRTRRTLRYVARAVQILEDDAEQPGGPRVGPLYHRRQVHTSPQRQFDVGGPGSRVVA